MSVAALFYDDVQRNINLALLVVVLVIEAFAAINCLTQRSDAFGAIGTLSKGAWLGLTWGALLITLIVQLAVPLFAFIGVTIAAIFLLDVRPALRDVADGPNSW